MTGNREASKGTALQRVPAVSGQAQPHRGMEHASKLSLSGGEEARPTSTSLPRVYFGRMDVSSLVSSLRAQGSEGHRKSSGRVEGLSTWKLSDHSAEKWHFLKDAAGTPSLTHTPVCHLTDELLGVSLWAEGAERRRETAWVLPKTVTFTLTI